MATTCTSARSTPLSLCTAGEQSSRGWGETDGTPQGAGAGGVPPPQARHSLGGVSGGVSAAPGWAALGPSACSTRPCRRWRPAMASLTCPSW